MIDLHTYVGAARCPRLVTIYVCMWYVWREREREQGEGRAEVGASSIFVSHHHTDRQTDRQTAKHKLEG